MRFPSKKFNIRGVFRERLWDFRPFTRKLSNIQTADGYIPKLTEL